MPLDVVAVGFLFAYSKKHDESGSTTQHGRTEQLWYTGTCVSPPRPGDGAARVVGAGRLGQQ